MSFRVAIVGAGPAGLYAGILLKNCKPEATVQVYERNPVDATFGFGVVFSDQALAFLAKDDPDTAQLFESRMESWTDISVAHRDTQISIDGIGFSSIGRLDLLTLLRERAQELGVDITYNYEVESVEALGKADLVIGADGINSVVRAQSPNSFGESASHLQNHFVWYGATKAFPTLSQSFKSTRFGAFNAHHYRYTPTASTFLVECGPDTLARAGLTSMDEAQSTTFCEEVFAEELEGAKLIANRSSWRQFPVLACAKWFHGNRVLVGDALHTAHFSIGSGTRLALEDVIALVRALESEEFIVAKALPRYQAEREPVLLKMTKAAAASAQWYEDFEKHMSLDPWRFALSYIRRAGRLDAERLRRLAPRFTDSLQSQGIEL
jgi:2-polyprenyl-6-methoxyphenol hydroxylase-like FAD-dependent oxidoreductase